MKKKVSLLFWLSLSLFSSFKAFAGRETLLYANAAMVGYRNPYHFDLLTDVSRTIFQAQILSNSDAAFFESYSAAEIHKPKGIVLFHDNPSILGIPLSFLGKIDFAGIKGAPGFDLKEGGKSFVYFAAGLNGLSIDYRKIPLYLKRSSVTKKLTLHVKRIDDQKYHAFNHILFEVKLFMGYPVAITKVTFFRFPEKDLTSFTLYHLAEAVRLKKKTQLPVGTVIVREVVPSELGKL